MSRLLGAIGLALALAAPSALPAQQDAAAVLRRAQKAEAPLPVRTFQLKQLSPDQAAKLVSPYVQGANSGVFSAGSGVRAITVRAPERTLALVDSVLNANDRIPATIVLRFRLIAAEDSVVHDPAIADVDSALRGLFRFRGYRLLAEGAVAAGEGSPTFDLTMNAASEPPGLGQFQVTGQVGGLVDDRAGRTVDLRVSLAGPRVKDGVGGAMVTTQFSTGLTVPIGQTVVLGSAAASGKATTVILAVRAEVAAAKR